MREAPLLDASTTADVDAVAVERPQLRPAGGTLQILADLCRQCTGHRFSSSVLIGHPNGDEPANRTRVIPRLGEEYGIIAGMKYLLIFLAVSLASCGKPPRTENGPARAPEGAIEGSENRSDASRTRTRT